MKRHQAGTEDEAGSFAGWLYADLLLGLVVVFLGAATIQLFGAVGSDEFAVVTDRDLSTTTTSSAAVTTTSQPTRRVKDFYKVPLKITFSPQETDVVRTAVLRFIETEGLVGEPEVSLVLLFGGVRDGEDPNSGAVRAKDLWPELIKALPDIFSERALLRPLNSRYLSPGMFSAEIFFQYFADE